MNLFIVGNSFLRKRFRQRNSCFLPSSPSQKYKNMELPWLRWWDLQGNLLLIGEERANRLTAQLRALGVEPEA